MFLDESWQYVNLKKKKKIQYYYHADSTVCEYLYLQIEGIIQKVFFVIFVPKTWVLIGIAAVSKKKGSPEKPT